MLLAELKAKLEALAARLRDVHSLAEPAANAMLAAMKKRIFADGKMPDGDPIGKYGSGRRRGRRVQLVDTGELRNSMRVVRTAKGAAIVAKGQGAKMRSIEAKYGNVFGIGVEERDAFSKALKK